MAIKPICTSLGFLFLNSNFLLICSTACLHASDGFFPERINSTTKCAPTTLIISSPWPVAVTAPTSLSTNKPAPIIGESPTRPCILKAMPLVVQAPDKLPLASKAIIPMVSWFSIFTTGLYWAVLSHSFHSFSDSLVSKFCFLKPCSKAN